MEVVADVVTYDPVRRKGFMKTVKPIGRRVHFDLGMLPDDFKAPVIEASRRINQNKKEPLPDAEWHELTRRITAMLMGHRFAFEAKSRDDGLLVILRKTARHLGPPPAAGA